MVAGFTLLLAKFGAVLTWVGSLFVAVFAAFWDLVRDAACWPFDQVMGIVSSAVTAVSFPGIETSLSAWGSLPAELINVMGLLHVGSCVAIITTAIGVRLALQLIPFVRLGS